MVAFVLVAVLVLVAAGILAGVRKRIGGEVIVAALMVGGIIASPRASSAPSTASGASSEHEADTGKGTESVADTANIVAASTSPADTPRARRSC